MLPVLPESPTPSPGNATFLPNTGPPFIVGDVVTYACENENVYFLTPSANAETTCENTGSFSHDANPPTCQQTCKYAFQIFQKNPKRIFGICRIRTGYKHINFDVESSKICSVACYDFCFTKKLNCMEIVFVIYFTNIFACFASIAFIMLSE